MADHDIRLSAEVALTNDMTDAEIGAAVRPHLPAFRRFLAEQEAERERWALVRSMHGNEV